MGSYRELLSLTPWHVCPVPLIRDDVASPLTTDFTVQFEAGFNVFSHLPASLCFVASYLSLEGF